MSNKRSGITEEELLKRRIAHAKRLKPMFEEPGSTASQMVCAYSLLLDLVMWDVAQEVHREAKTADMSSQRRPSTSGQQRKQGAPALTAEPAAPKAEAATAPSTLPPHPLPGRAPGLDIFGQAHPSTATELVTCQHCKRQTAAGKFAPHLQKCLGKDRAASRVASRKMVGLK